MLICERGGECIVVAFITAEAFSSKDGLKGFGFWAALIVEFGIIFLTLLFPAFVILIHFLIHSFARCFKKSSTDSIERDFNKSSISESSISLSVSTFQSIRDALFTKRRDTKSNSLCHTWCILFCHELRVIFFWFFLCSSKATSPAAETRSSGKYATTETDEESLEGNIPAPSHNNKFEHANSSFEFHYTGEDSDDEENITRIHCNNEDDFAAMNIQELKHFINEEGGSYADCIEIGDLRERARHIAHHSSTTLQEEKRLDDEQAQQRQERPSRGSASSVRFISHQYSV
mmetsp:Transcript_2554/g.3449  ORF Transcript_2554/g.3449 Transcript_2554/m.3449 type:complete len:289 (+) Transcript_2554:1437-2303(+)